MAKKRSKRRSKTNGAKTASRRGAPEAIAKRKAARALNTLFAKGAPAANGVDGRTAKRRARLLKELKEGRNGKPLKPIEVLGYATELLAAGETLSSLRKVSSASKFPATDESLELARTVQSQYQFDPRAWRLLGVDMPEWAAS